jgi:hypothetical protein
MGVAGASIAAGAIGAGAGGAVATCHREGAPVGGPTGAAGVQHALLKQKQQLIKVNVLRGDHAMRDRS